MRYWICLPVEVFAGLEKTLRGYEWMVDPEELELNGHSRAIRRTSNHPLDTWVLGRLHTVWVSLILTSES